MAQTRGKVTGITGDGWARLIIERTDACSGCQTTHNCHSCLSHAKTEARALNGVGAQPGDLVSVSINTETLLKSAAVLYLLPVLGLLAGAVMGPVAGETLGLGETGSAILFGFAGLCLGFLSVTIYSRKMSAKNRLTPIIDRIISPENRMAPVKAGCHFCTTNLPVSAQTQNGFAKNRFQT